MKGPTWGLRRWPLALGLLALGLIVATPDAYVEGIMQSVLCAPPPSPCPETPAYEIVRGQSRISVTIATGRINGEQLGVGEERVFDFLREALR